ncbi:MAG: S41 family peptidase [Bacteroidota bacterium]
MKIKIYSTLFFLLLICVSCERLFMEEPELSAKAIFDEAWTFADREYSFFEFKEIDWQEQYEQYLPRVDSVSTSEELFEVIADMLYELRDGHVNLRAGFDRSRNWRWFLDHPVNYDYDLLERSYFKEEEQFVGPFIVYDFEDVGYLHYRSFSFDFSNASLTYIINRFKDHKGIIIDIRDNGGGSSGNVGKIANRFTDDRVLAGRERFRNGIGHDDFSDWEAAYIEAYEPEETQDSVLYRFTKPVVLLTNRSCYSAASFFTQYMRELPNVTTMGDWTGGGGGGPSFTELANGWILRVSNTQFESPEGFIIEDGIPPDVRIDLEKTDQDQGKDTILEAALALLRK